MTLQGKLRPLQAKVTSMKASLSEYSEKLRHQEGKVKVRGGGGEGRREGEEEGTVECYFVPILQNPNCNFI